MSRRLEAIIVAAALVLVAGSVGLILWGGLGLDRNWAALASILVAVGLVWLASRTRRVAALDHAARRAEGLEAAVRALEKRFGDLSARVDSIDRRVIETSRVTVRAVSTELESLGTVVRDLAETVALHEADLRTGLRVPAAPVPAPMPVPTPSTEVVTERTPPRVATPVAAEPAMSPESGPVEATQAAEVAVPAARRDAVPVDAVVRALVGERVALFLQPVVGLPDRRVQLYQLLGRVSHAGQPRYIEHEDVAAVAARHGLLGRFETSLVREAYRIARHLRARSRDVPIIVNVSPASAADSGFHERVAETLAEHPDLTGAVVLAVGQAAWAESAGLEAEALEALHGLGAGFVLDEVADLRLDPADLARRGIRHVRLSAQDLLSALDGAIPSDIHPLDVPGLLARQSIGTIVSGVDVERTLVELSDFGVELAQGGLFSAPRAVRRDVLVSEPPAPAPARAEEAGAAPDPDAGGARVTVETVDAPPQRASLRSVLRRTRA